MARGRAPIDLDSDSESHMKNQKRAKTKTQDSDDAGLDCVVDALFDAKKRCISEAKLRRCLGDVDMDTDLAARMLTWIEEQGKMSKSELKRFFNTL